MQATNYAQVTLDELKAQLPGLDDSLARLYALLVFTRGTQTTLEDVHDAWALWRSTTNPAHKSLVPFGELSLEVQELDRKYMQVIRDLAGNR